MLEDHYLERLDLLLARLTSSVDLPEWWSEAPKQQVREILWTDERRHLRREVREEAICELTAGLPALERSHAFYKVHVRNISRSGIAFLHSRQLYPLEKVTIWSRTGKQQYSVARCVKLRDQCFEIGAASGCGTTE